MKPKKLILSGMRPTGQIHIGNWAGALANWIQLQDDPENLCFFMVADWHALTTEYQDTSAVESNIQEMVLDWITAGIDPERAILFRQSWVKEHSELSLILSMITPLSWLERNPTYKEQMKELADKDISTHGFLGYPVLQAADILLYRATHVPVGEDQLPHLELTREIARRFNFMCKKEIFVEPQAILSPTPKVLGIDARKMSKSYHNTIHIAEEEPELKNKIQSMYTDPQKIRAKDLGHPTPCPENPTGCTVFSLHKIFENSAEKTALREKECREGQLGCVACKKDLLDEINALFKPLRRKRSELAHKNGLIQDILREGSLKARKHAMETLGDARKAIHYHELV
ncbi:MAG: tryptophan--tRNA ligase [Elusimicrobia bacterium]|nr:tryptophan--tRNA ligase [Elusimicrobiota bacterium]